MAFNLDQARNLDAHISAVAQQLHSSWRYLRLLQGFHEEFRSNREMRVSVPHAFETIYRGLFNALFACIGTVVDRTQSTLSLFCLLKMAHRYSDQGSELARLTKQLQNELINSPIPAVGKLEKWRMKVVAHHTVEGQGQSFYVDNKLQLAEIEQALAHLTQLLNRLMLRIPGQREHDVVTDNDRLIAEGRSIVRAIRLIA